MANGTIQAQIQRPANWLMGIFLLILLLATGISEFFQAPTEQNTELTRFRTLFTKEDFANITELKLRNRLGDFHFSKVENDPYSRWNMVLPKRFPANNEVLKKLFETLKDLKIRKIFSYDPINIANFSLDAPLYEITLIGTDGKKKVLSFGLVNPIDNSTYVSNSAETEAIYHIDAVQSDLASLDMTDFVDSHIFTPKSAQVKTLKIYRGSVSGTPAFQLQRGDRGEWISRGRELDEAKTLQWMDELLLLKTMLIVDKSTPELDDSVQKLIESPQFTLEIEDLNENVLTWSVSNSINSLPDVRVEKRAYVLIKASNRPYPYLIHKDQLRLFQPREQDMRKLPINKIFY